MKRVAVVFASTFLAQAGGAHAADDWYIGIGGGAAHQDEQRLPLAAVDDTHSDTRTTAWKIFLGRRLSPYFAVQAGYADYGAQRFGATGHPTCCHPGPNPLDSFSMERRVSGGELDVVAEWPFSAHWALIGSLGVAYLRVRTSGDVDVGATPFGPATHLTLSASDWHSAPRGTLGLAWNPGGEWHVRLEAEAVRSVGEPLGYPLLPKSGESPIRAVTVSLVRSF